MALKGIRKGTTSYLEENLQEFEIGIATDVTPATLDDIPTNNNQLTNGAGYQTADDVAQAISEIEVAVDVDDSTISYNSDDSLQVVGILDKNSGASNGQWTGTLAQYNEATSNNTVWIPGVVYYISDDNENSVYEASNVSTYINGNLISDIFESDGTTVKNATNATNAAQLGGVAASSYSTIKIYSGTAEPTSDIGNDGDLYIQLEE